MPPVVSLLSAATLLTACGGAPIPKEIGRACLNVSIEGQEAAMLGYPVHMLEEVWRKGGGRVRMDESGIIVLSRHDPLTKRDKVVRLQVETGKSDLRTDQCGPASVAVVGMTVDGRQLSEDETLDAMLAIARSAAEKFGMALPTPVGAQSFGPTTTRVESTSPSPPTTTATTPPADEPASSSQAVAPGATTPPPPGNAALTIDYARCMSSEDARSELPAALKECVNDELRRQDSTLNARYRDALGRLDPPHQRVLRGEERSWLTQNAAMCRREEGADGDIMDDLAYGQCVLKRTVERASQLAAVQ